MFPEVIAADFALASAVVAALSEGQRAIAHLVVLLAVPAVVGLVLLIRRLRRPSDLHGTGRIPEGDDERW